MVYNLTGIVQNGTTVLGFTQGVNDVLLLGWLGTILLIGLFIVLFTSFNFATNGNNPTNAFATASFISLIFAILMKAINLINDITLIIVLVLAGISLAAIKNSNQ